MKKDIKTPANKPSPAMRLPDGKDSKVDLLIMKTKNETYEQLATALRLPAERYSAF